MQQNVELQRQLETLRAKFEYTFALLNEKLDQHGNASGQTIVQTAIEQMRLSDAKLQELELKNSSQQEENDLLRYLVSFLLSLNKKFNELKSKIKTQINSRVIIQLKK